MPCWVAGSWGIGTWRAAVAPDNRGAGGRGARGGVIGDLETHVAAPRRATSPRLKATRLAAGAYEQEGAWVGPATDLAGDRGCACMLPAQRGHTLRAALSGSQQALSAPGSTTLRGGATRRLSDERAPQPQRTLRS